MQNHFSGKMRQLLKHSDELSPYIWVSYKFVLKSVNSLNQIFWAMEYWSKALKCQIWLTTTKQVFWESEVNIESSPKLSPYSWASYKFVLKSVNSLNQIFWATEYWFKALKCQIWLTNTKPFFWESEAKVETLPKPSPYIWVSYKFVLKSVKSLNRIFWATEYWFKALKCIHATTREAWLRKKNKYVTASDASEVSTLGRALVGVQGGQAPGQFHVFDP